MKPITRIPATVVATASGQETPGKVVVVMVSELDYLESAFLESSGVTFEPYAGWIGDLRAVVSGGAPDQDALNAACARLRAASRELRRVGQLMQRGAIMGLNEGYDAGGLISGERHYWRQLREDILNVVTVYDSHTPVENRGVWRDRLVAFAESIADDNV
jgi:hypothetical protein